MSKTQESLRLKTRYMKGITAEQLFIISMQEIIRVSSFINNFFKNKDKQTRHTLFILFQLFYNIIITK
jgi:hypothetical protein